MVLIEYLAANTVSNGDYFISEIEQSYIEDLSYNDGAIGLLMSSLSSEQCDKLNSLLYPDMP